MLENKTDNAPDDMALVMRARDGDGEAFESLVQRYRNEVYALCYYFTRNREDAWDLAQEVFVKVWRALGRFRGEAGFKTWLMRITANHCKDHLKKRRVEITSYDDALQPPDAETGDTPSSAAAAGELGAAIDAAVSQLPPKLQLTFVLREYKGLSYQEMAEVMQCSVGTVMSRLFNARKRLQAMLTDVAEHR
ncbi:MAG TPA: sigma-70 family RNA polymerase sigma factor [Candidatus Hydrogenedentes bacterium]|nr:sigma-70 family RNA polymerase sigma factor [Candidatus Hydrogenedentota bacterium]